MIWNTAFFLLITIKFCTCQSKELVFTHVMYRHGDCSPGKTFPTDPYKEDSWPQGWGQLTKIGMQQQFELGQYLKTRYKNFLKKTYRREEIYVRSTDKDRTLQSALCNIAGLFPAEDFQQWSNEIPTWQPIPVHAIPDDEDILLNMGAECPEYEKEFNTTTLPRVEKYNKDYKEFFEYLKKKTGLDKLDFLKIGHVYDPLFRERAQGWPLPPWADEIYDQKTKKTVYEIVVELKTIRRLVEYDSSAKAKYTSGFLLGDIIQRMKEKTKNAITKPTKMIMYSAHDGTLMAFMAALNISNGLIVPYASCFMVELYKTVKSDFVVEIHFRNQTGKEPHRMTVLGCQSFSCPLSEFEAAVQKTVLYSAEERNKYCGIVSKCEEKTQIRL